jgi:hypothetical protein
VDREISPLTMGSNLSRSTFQFVCACDKTKWLALLEVVVVNYDFFAGTATSNLSH